MYIRRLDIGQQINISGMFLTVISILLFEKREIRKKYIKYAVLCERYDVPKNIK